jgi:hypothetical protein
MLLGGVDLVDGDDVGVVEGGDGAGLADEAAAAAGVRAPAGGQDVVR